ncbi:MAG TPA: carboxypeptidase regulatory-like domain-containing protein [Vicinamibacterales bacterium]|nr:carboxypeptidase regulatory-like domain-containing protein [Vicinamibacterales bacterium]
MNRRAVTVVAVLWATIVAHGAAQRADLIGRVVFAGVGVPGATVSAIRDARTLATLSTDDGTFKIADVDNGTWTLRVEMRGFVPVTREIVVPIDGVPPVLTLTMKTLVEIVGQAAAVAARPARPAAAVSDEQAPPETADIINGSIINGAATPFAQPRAFGNNRPRLSSLYNGGVNVAYGNSAWNAAPYSFTSPIPPAPSYDDLQLGFNVGGPLRIPWVLKYGPQTFLNVQHSVSHNATTHSALMPTAAERGGDFSQSGVVVRDPRTGQPFEGNVIPSDRISPQAAALLAYYPLPNATATSGANYQTPILASVQRDSLQVNSSKSLRRTMSLAGSFSFQRTETDSVSLFNFADASGATAINGSLSFSRRMTTRMTMRVRYQFTRATTDVTPYFANRTNVSGDAGITGNNQDPVNWGPPTLAFAGIAGLTDVTHQETSRTSNSGGGELLYRRGGHNMTIGGDVRGDRTDVLSQPDPRGTLSFTGPVTGVPFADFLLGVPTASSIAFGDTSTRLRAKAFDAYFNDDWRPLANLTINLGVRWEYETPYTEQAGHLVNLDVAPRFAAIAQVTPATPAGALTGATYPASLIRPDKGGVQPRLGVSWRPSLSSSLVLRGAYGMYRNLGIYESLALLLAHQPPFSTSFSIHNSLETPLTLANPFPSALPGTTNTVAIDPDLRSSYAHNWSVTMQRELPASLTVIAAYLGAKGSHLMQAFLPNTYPAGALNPCPSCPSGFVYVTSNGSSLRNAAQFTLRRRLHAGLMASVQYTIAKSTDDAATFANNVASVSALSIAQDWLNLDAERGPSAFDQRHLLSVQFQYTTGQGLQGGTLVDGKWATLFKDWTVASQLTTGSGLPLTPISFLAVSGTGVVGIRPALTGEPTAPAAAGSYANAAAYTTPALGTWGDAGRNSIRGPAQFALDLSVARVFRLGGRWNLEWRLIATNVLNRVTFATIDTVVTSPQFGFPTLANPMRTLQMGVRLRF